MKFIISYKIYQGRILAILILKDAINGLIIYLNLIYLKIIPHYQLLKPKSHYLWNR